MISLFPPPLYIRSHTNGLFHALDFKNCDGIGLVQIWVEGVVEEGRKWMRMKKSGGKRKRHKQVPTVVAADKMFANLFWILFIIFVLTGIVNLFTFLHQSCEIRFSTFNLYVCASVGERERGIIRRVKQGTVQAISVILIGKNSIN